MCIDIQDVHTKIHVYVHIKYINARKHTHVTSQGHQL